MLNGESWFKPADSELDTALLPFLLADEGFDVWIGHHRATFWSHDHVTVTHEDQVYWNWTWDQLAQYDVPTMLRFVRDETRQKVHVVGFSQGATVSAAAATKRNIGDIMNSLTLIGPTIYRGRTNPLLVRAWAGIFSDLMKQVPAPSGLNFRTVMTPNWRKFDHGTPQLNFETYGQPNPPDYEPTDIPVDLRLLVIHGGHDLYSPSEGVMEFLATMQNRPSRVFLPSYAHLDLFFSNSRKDDVYVHISKFLKFNNPA